MEEIYKGTRHTITTDGLVAEKSDGLGKRRNMRYYPERDIAAVAGEIDELTAWMILRDVSLQVEKSKTPICPEHILIDGQGFVLSEWSESLDERYIAPEGYSPVWALGATVFYTFLGCHVFQGLGGKGQSASAPIPTLRRELPALSNIIVKCLDFNPQKRPTLSSLAQTAAENIGRCQSQLTQFPPLKVKTDGKIRADEIDTYWPEQMC